MQFDAKFEKKKTGTLKLPGQEINPLTPKIRCQNRLMVTYHYHD